MALDSATKKRNQRAREKAALAKHGGQRVHVLFYGETMSLLNKECERYGFTGQQRYAECLTHILHLRSEEHEQA